MSRTKIVATIGPASSNPETIRRLLGAGMTVARVNFSHGDHESHALTIQTLRQVASSEGKILGVLGDLQGPKIRLGNVRRGGLQLALGDEIVLTPYRGQPGMVHLPHPDLIEAVLPGARLVIGDGEVELTVAEKRADTLRCITSVAGRLESRKGVNAPGTDLPISAITEKDEIDLSLVCKLDLDFVALSFVRSPADVNKLRAMIAAEGRNIPIVAKIEKREAIDNLDAICDAADGMMVARGDLGIEVHPQEVPMLQKRIIRTCNLAGKPVITATQMLQSMVEHPQPTRAEASDVANAILDGTDAVMLSNETATGRFPVEAVMMMKNIAEIVEREFPYHDWRMKRQEEGELISDTTRAISAASCAVAEQVQARAIVCTTMSGLTAVQIARHRPPTPIMAVSPLERTQRFLTLTWGVDCVIIPDFSIQMRCLPKRPKPCVNSDLIPEINWSLPRVSLSVKKVRQT